MTGRWYVYATEDEEPVCQSPIGKQRRKRLEEDNHEDGYTIQNTLRYVGKQGAWVYILDLLDDAKGNIVAEMEKRLEMDNGARTTRKPNEERGDLHV